VIDLGIKVANWALDECVINGMLEGISENTLAVVIKKKRKESIVKRHDGNF
jgi:hypothetical protein